MIAGVFKSNKIVVEKSTVQVKRAETIEKILTQNNKGIKFQILSNLEILTKGTAMEDPFSPDRILIGGREAPDGQNAIKAFKLQIPSTKLSNLAANAYMVERISSVNAMTTVYGAARAEISCVAHSMGKDIRIRPKFLKSQVELLQQELKM